MYLQKLQQNVNVLFMAEHLRDKVTQQYKRSRCCLIVTWQRVLTAIRSDLNLLQLLLLRLCSLSTDWFIWPLSSVCVFYMRWVYFEIGHLVDFGSSECFRKASGKSSWCHCTHSLSLSLESLFILAWWVWLHHITSNWAQFQLDTLQASVFTKENNITESWIKY